VPVVFELVPDKVVAFEGEKNIQIKKQGKDQMRATVIFLIGCSVDGTSKKARPFTIFKGRPEGRLARDYQAYNNDPNSPCFIIFQYHAWYDG
jgi:hypothetical protein